MIYRDSRHSNSTLYPHETGGNQQSMPCHNALAGALGACIDAADIAEDRGSWLFRIARGGGWHRGRRSSDEATRTPKRRPRLLFESAPP